MAVQDTVRKLHNDIGQVLSRLLRRRVPIVQIANFAFTDVSGTKYYPILLPSGAMIIDLWVDVMVAFDSGTTDVIDVGYKETDETATEDVDAFIDNQDIKTAIARFEMNTGAAEWAKGHPLTQDTLIVITTTRDGAAATVGNGRVVVEYILDDGDVVDAVDYGV